MGLQILRRWVRPPDVIMKCPLCHRRDICLPDIMCQVCTIKTLPKRMAEWVKTIKELIHDYYYKHTRYR